MSGLVTGWVLKYSPVEDARELLVLVVLAECAHDDGHGAYPSIDTIAKRARTSRRKVQYVLRDLEAADRIRDTGKTPKGTTIWQVLMDRGDDYHAANWAAEPVTRKGDARRAPVHAGAPEPPIEPPTTERQLEPDGSTDGSGAQRAPQPELDPTVTGPPPPTAAQAAAWQQARGELERRASELRWSMWLEPLELAHVAGHTYTLAAPPHIAPSIRERYHAMITAALRTQDPAATITITTQHAPGSRAAGRERAETVAHREEEPCTTS